MTLIIVSFIAGVLTVLAPCILPLIPVIIGGSVSDAHSRLKPYVVTASLAVSVVLFTLLLKVSTALIDISPDFWKWFSGTILFLFALSMIFPTAWAKLGHKTGIERWSNKLLAQGHQKQNFTGDIIMGASLGPVFTTCSPTFFVILATVLPQNFFVGLVNLIAYAVGLSLILLLISLLGQKFANKLGVLANPKGWFKKLIGVIFLLVAVAIVTGFDKDFQTYVLDKGFFDVTKLETKILEKIDTDELGDTTSDTSAGEGTPFVEIENPSGFVNTDPITIGQFVGEKVILIDFMTYSCINCQRTFPYLVDWYSKYEDDGLIIIGIHTPEFAFEKDIDNVRQAMKDNGIEFPVVLDNDYGTWRAYQNRYWPRKYLIDIHGNIVYDHIGEGAYKETEMKIQELLKERMEVLGEAGELNEALTDRDYTSGKRLTPEIYFGALRNDVLGNGARGVTGKQTLTIDLATIKKDVLYLSGVWNIQDEFARAEAGNTVVLPYRAGKVHIVAESSNGGKIRVLKDNVELRTVSIDEPTLYTMVDSEYDDATLTLEVVAGTVDFYTFTFGE